MHREYLLRFISLSLVFLACSIGIGIAAMVPRLFALSLGEVQVAAKSAQTTPAAAAADKENAAQLAAFRDVLTALDPKSIKSEPVLLSTLIRTLIHESGTGISITDFTFKPVSSTKTTLNISGVATDRTKLAAFTARLSNDGVFTTANLPISNLSQKQDIDFTINLSIGK